MYANWPHTYLHFTIMQFGSYVEPVYIATCVRSLEYFYIVHLLLLKLSFAACTLSYHAGFPPGYLVTHLTSL